MPSTTVVSRNGRGIDDTSVRRSVGAGVARRRRGRIAAGALVISFTVLAAVLFYGSVGDRRAVLTVARAVSAGEAITAADLSVARVSADPNLSPVPASARTSVIGQVAVVNLMPGTLLSRRSLATGPAVPAGMAVTGALLKPGQYPSALRVGDRVLLVALPGDAAPTSTPGEGVAPDPSVLGEATVLAVEPVNDASAGTTVSLVVPEPRAANVAAVGAAQRLSLVTVRSS
jgi:hypothetical protein